jgi:hypothetical protein
MVVAELLHVFHTSTTSKCFPCFSVFLSIPLNVPGLYYPHQSHNFAFLNKLKLRCLTSAYSRFTTMAELQETNVISGVSQQPAKVRMMGVGPFDVLLGRSPKVYSGPGNQAFRDLIHEHLGHYSKNATRSEKASLVLHILCKIRTNGGRFKRISEDGTWAEVPVEVAKEKICHALRDARLVCNRNALDRNTHEPRKGTARMLERAALPRHLGGSRWQTGVVRTSTMENDFLPQNPVSIQNSQSNGWTGIDSTVSQELILDCQIQSLLRLRRAIMSQQLGDFDILPNHISGVSTLFQQKYHPEMPSTGYPAFFEHEATPMALSHSQSKSPTHTSDQYSLRPCEVSHCPPSRDSGLSPEVTNELDDASFPMWQDADHSEDNHDDQSLPPLIHIDHDRKRLSPTRCRISSKLQDHVAPWNALVPQALRERNMDNRSSTSPGSNQSFGTSFEDDNSLPQIGMNSTPINTQIHNDCTYDMIKRALTYALMLT